MRKRLVQAAGVVVLCAAGGDHTRAFPAYVARLMSFITAQQDKVRRSTRWLIPR